MIRKNSFLAFLFLLAACSGGGQVARAPSNLDNACAIVAQRPDWLRDMRRVERNWGVPVNVQMATIYQESKFIGNARTPYRYSLGVIPMGRRSSAYGYSQALDATWEEYQRKTGHSRARRDNFADSVDFMGWYMDGNKRGIGIAKTDARRQYLAYHEGRTGYLRGTYNNKTWLLRISGEVDTRSELYRNQLLRCGKL